METVYLSRASSASISIRGITGILFFSASTTSGFGLVHGSGRHDDVRSFYILRGVTDGDCCAQPLKVFSYFCFFQVRTRDLVTKVRRTSAIPDIPEPPIPTKCMCLILLNNFFSSYSVMRYFLYRALTVVVIPPLMLKISSTSIDNGFAVFTRFCEHFIDYTFVHHANHSV